MKGQILPSKQKNKNYYERRFRNMKKENEELTFSKEAMLHIKRAVIYDDFTSKIEENRESFPVEEYKELERLLRLLTHSDDRDQFKFVIKSLDTMIMKSFESELEQLLNFYGDVFAELKNIEFIKE